MHAKLNLVLKAGMKLLFKIRETKMYMYPKIICKHILLAFVHRKYLGILSLMLIAKKSPKHKSCEIIYSKIFKVSKKQQNIEKFGVKSMR